MNENILVHDLAVVILTAGLLGFLFQRIGLSAVVGYIVAGLVVGPHAPPFKFISDLDEIQALSQLGLVFLMFSMGLEISIGKLRRLGIGLILSVVSAAILGFNIVREVSQLAGLEPRVCLLLASMVVASSSAVVTKGLKDSGRSHDRIGSTAMSFTVLEDIVAVVILTFVSSAASLQNGPKPPFGSTMTSLAGFVAVTVIGGLLVLPRLLRMIGRQGDDLLITTVAGLALMSGTIAVRSGYSLALGAFVIGATVAGLPQRAALENLISGVRDIFIAVFFVAIGLLINPEAILNNLPAVVGFAALAVGARIIGVSFGLLLTGRSERDAFQTALLLTPIGELAFIVAQISVAGHLLPPKYFPIAVGAATLSAFFAPIFVRFAEPLSGFVERLEPSPLKRLFAGYRDFLTTAGEQQRRIRVLQALQAAALPIGLSFAFMTGLMLSASSIWGTWLALFPNRQGNLYHNLFWAVLGVIMIVPLFVTSRAVQSIVRTVPADHAQTGPQTRDRLVVWSTLGMSTTVLLVWLWLLLPASGSSAWFFSALVISGVFVGLFFRRQFLALPHRIGSRLTEASLSSEDRRRRAYQVLLDQYRDWGLRLVEIRVPDSAAVAGQTLRQLEIRNRYSCSVIGINRSGFSILNPGADTVLYPDDTLFVLGSLEQVRALETAFANATATPARSDLLNELQLETFALSNPLWNGRTLAELNIPKRFGLIVAGICRDNGRQLTPPGEEKIHQGDLLLVVGPRDKIQICEETLAEPSNENPQGSAAKGEN
jgi:monovalent cation:H+ antiporter-2, CPA2 family